jgi:peptidyl-prolyl cis-trans isomerase B (cyclophilin B)
VRVVPQFVVQGGNSEDPRAQEMRWLIGKHTLPSEFDDRYRHVRGAVAMGRTYKGNPDKRSASYDFYIVVGRKVTAVELQQIEREKGFTYTEAQKERYYAEGGTPHLDNEHTVFGRLVDGWEVLDRLSKVPTDESDWPLERLEMRVSAVN